jgi:tetratricopeptide (TPR) repeat protein
MHDDPRVRSEIAIVAASTQVFASPPGVATTFAREAADGLSDGLADQRQALIAIQRISGFMHSLGEGWKTPAPEPQGQGPGARMLATTVALEAVLAGTGRERAIAMARFALDGDHLIAVDDGLFWVNAAAVRILSDDDIGEFWSRARAASHARGSLFATLSTSLWEGFWQWRRGELHEALACLRAALDQDRLWGGTRVGEPFARAFQIGCHLDRGDLGAARQAADSFAGTAAFGEGGRVYQQAVARLLVAEGRCDEALLVLAEPPSTDYGIAIVNPVWNPWRSIKAAALYGLGRTPQAIETAEEELALLRVWGAPSFLGRALCMLGELRGRAGLDDLAEAVDLLASTSAAVDLARAQCALGSHPDVADEEAIALLDAASRLAEQRGARGIRERALAALERRGHRIEPGADDVRPLSRTDRQILDMTAAGLDVHEVAQRLFVTPGTVRAVLDEAGFRAKPGGSGISQVGRATMTHDQNGSLQ